MKRFVSRKFFNFSNDEENQIKIDKNSQITRAEYMIEEVASK